MENPERRRREKRHGGRGVGRMRPTPLLFSGSHGDAALLPPNSSRSHSPCPFPNFCYSSRPAAGLGPPRAQFCGCSSAVERYLAKVNVEGSIPFTRFEDQPEGRVPSGCAFSRFQAFARAPHGWRWSRSPLNRHRSTRCAPAQAHGRSASARRACGGRSWPSARRSRGSRRRSRCACRRSARSSR